MDGQGPALDGTSQQLTAEQVPRLLQSGCQAHAPVCQSWCAHQGLRAADTQAIGSLGWADHPGHHARAPIGQQAGP